MIIDTMISANVRYAFSLSIIKEPNRFHEDGFIKCGYLWLYDSQSFNTPIVEINFTIGRSETFEQCYGFKLAFDAKCFRNGSKFIDSYSRFCDKNHKNFNNMGTFLNFLDYKKVKGIDKQEIVSFEKLMEIIKEQFSMEIK